MEKSDEIKLIEQVKQGDLMAFRLLVDKHKTMAFHIAVQIVRNVEDAEEIAQDAFLNAYQAINRFKGESKFSTWFYRIVYNLAVSKTRKKKIETSHIDETEISDYEIAEAYEEYTSLEKEEKTSRLMEAINELKEDESLIITLFYIHENTIEEISAVTDLSISNVKIKLHRSRKKLFQLLNEQKLVEKK